jgi:hypothetical protein
MRFWKSEPLVAGISRSSLRRGRVFIIHGLYSHIDGRCAADPPALDRNSIPRGAAATARSQSNRTPTRFPAFDQGIVIYLICNMYGCVNTTYRGSCQYRVRQI